MHYIYILLTVQYLCCQNFQYLFGCLLDVVADRYLCRGRQTTVGARLTLCCVGVSVCFIDVTVMKCRGSGQCALTILIGSLSELLCVGVYQ